MRTSSSETIRKISLTPKGADSFPNIDQDWLIWFIGFSEGDGYIGAHNNQLRFIITQKECNILYEIQNKLNMGKVTLRKDNYYTYAIYDSEDILKLAQLFNGNLVLPSRISQLSLWLTILNQKGFPLMIENLSPKKPSLNDAWLSGFTDAEGSFNVNIFERKESELKRVKKRFILDQNNFFNEF